MLLERVVRAHGTLHQVGSAEVYAGASLLTRGFAAAYIKLSSKGSDMIVNVMPRTFGASPFSCRDDRADHGVGNALTRTDAPAMLRTRQRS
jgi:hypothetical protein